jgi:hypothetical protein
MDPDPDPDPDPTSNPTPFFSDFKDAQKIFFFCIFFLLTRKHIIFSLCSVVDPDPHQRDKLDPDQIAYVKPKCMEYEPF